jgi:hypothetical protein
MSKPTNRHPVDELADIREQIRSLQFREKELRRMILDGECEAMGFDYEAYVTPNTYERIDLHRLKQEFGMQALRPFLQSRESVNLRLRRML